MVWFGNGILNGINSSNGLEWLNDKVWWSWLWLIKLPCGIQGNTPSKHVNEQFVGYMGFPQENLIMEHLWGTRDSPKLT